MNLLKNISPEFKEKHILFIEQSMNKQLIHATNIWCIFFPQKSPQVPSTTAVNEAEGLSSHILPLCLGLPILLASPLLARTGG